jgi:hypothetical protein
VSPPDRREAAAAAALVLFGVGLRLFLVALYPTVPLSDFRGLVLFGLRLRDEGLTVPGWHWVQFSPGLPLLLSALFRVFPRGVFETARNATAIVTGLAPLMPFLIWRRVLALRWRFLAGLLLAVWPGQVVFSGVVAQENWALLPAVALACLAVRRLRDPASGGFPVAAGLLYAVAGVMRQELLLAMLPPMLAAAGLPGARASRGGRVLRLAAAAGAPLIALAGWRAAATGRFAVTTEHGGLGVLGTLAPGSARAGWVDPMLFAASTEPRFLTDGAALRREAWRLAVKEARRRWRFHAFRAAVSGLRLSAETETRDLLWSSLEEPGAQPPERAASAASLARRVRPWLRAELCLISGFFAASLLLGLRRRDPALFVVGAAVILETLAVILFSALGRLMVPAIGLELLVLPLAASTLDPAGRRGEAALFLALGIACAALLFRATPPLERLAIRRDEAPPRLSEFPMLVAGGGGVFGRCDVERGYCSAFSGDRARIEPGAGSGAPGRSLVRCRLPRLPADAALFLDFDAPAEAVVRIEADGRTLAAPAKPGPVWRRVVLAAPGEPRPREVALEAEGAVGFGVVSRRTGAPPLPRDRTFP